jgi:hypothetical protein
MTDAIVEAPDEPEARRQFRELLDRKRPAILPEPVYPPPVPPPSSRAMALGRS